jgi:hypothetical protein
LQKKMENPRTTTRLVSPSRSREPHGSRESHASILPTDEDLAAQHHHYYQHTTLTYSNGSTSKISNSYFKHTYAYMNHRKKA